ncbi:MAG: hypothetical protein ACRCSG_01770 [Cellulosilyticaceae bacterium]
MKLTELRLSSLFYPIDRSKEIHLPIETPYKVCTIGFKVEAIPYDKVEKWTEFNPKDLSPIPLTEKWLLEFGFNKDYKSGYIGKDFYNQDFVLAEPFVMGEWQKGYAFEFTSGGWSKFKEFNYVHELQNFYFAMTGEDLLTVGGRS